MLEKNNSPEPEQDIDMMICWFDQSKKLMANGKYTIKHTTNEARCIIKEIRYKLDINTLHRNLEDLNIGMNDIARIKIRTTKPLFVDPYSRNRNTGAVIIIDEQTNNTVGAGMVI